jgi:hypothetical protein
MEARRETILCKPDVTEVGSLEMDARSSTPSDEIAVFTPQPGNPSTHIDVMRSIEDTNYNDRSAQPHTFTSTLKISIT